MGEAARPIARVWLRLIEGGMTESDDRRLHRLEAATTALLEAAAEKRRNEINADILFRKLDEMHGDVRESRDWQAAHEEKDEQRHREMMRFREDAERRFSLRERTTDRAQLERRFPWVLDPTLEEPVFSERAFLELERHRARSACDPDPADLERLFAILEEMRAAAGPRLAVLVLPDEFQVEDELWRQVGFADGVELDRDRPQRVIGAWLEERGVPWLDLLPRMRAVPPGPDGRRHLYHRRDTHWNARGNRIAGEALAEFLVELGIAQRAEPRARR